MTEDAMESKGTTVIEGAEEKVEEAELDAYLDQENANGEGPSADERKGWLSDRYKQIKTEYKSLVMNIEEAEARGNKENVMKLRELVRQNYKVRKWLVKSLRAMGEKCEDKFVPC